ncbi:lytic transglycosylase domain-containing protein [Granulicella sibirica]|uniref:Soluble lytic murein transglycosylase n=1 Tax=Granulicella sibirica TaxID=2479048 RepID=A0A4Q0T0Z4_9BACT|nr:lytic transglycosylase domain-containing protein [Granulicella sibirica]RXH55066.1 Soluble lytic murein transglycosylase precursor [Granulicella sibirica]
MLLAATAVIGPVARAAEHITLTNGFELDCLRREMLPDSGKVRLYPLTEANANGAEPSSYMDVSPEAIRLIEPLADLPKAILPSSPLPAFAAPAPASLHSLLSQAGAAHHIDTDLLASLVNAESGGHANAVSRTGARGLMQLMPGTASSLGVQDAFRPEQNVAGGTTYLDQLLTRYHDDIALALAAYNAGPGAVDRYHGIPPYRETRAYVARIITEYNRRKRQALLATAHQP